MNDSHELDQPQGEGEVSRRCFLFKTATAVSSAAVAAVTGAAVGVAAVHAAEAPATPVAMPPTPSPASYVPGKHRYVYLIDINKCIGCGSCVRACETREQRSATFLSDVDRTLHGVAHRRRDHRLSERGTRWL